MRLPTPLRRSRPLGPPAPFIVGVTRSGTTLLRLMLDAHPEMAIPPETHFVPSLIKADPQARRDLRGGARDRHRASPVGRLQPRFGGAAAALLRARPDRSRDDDPRLLRALRRGPGQAALGRQDPQLREADEADRELDPRGPVHPHDPRRPRRCAVPLQADPQGPAADGDRRRALGPQGRGGARRRGRAELHRGPVRGAGPRHRGGAAADRRVPRAALGRRDAALLRARRGAPRGDAPRPPRRRGQAAAPRRPPQGGPRADLEAARPEPAGALEAGHGSGRRRRVRERRGAAAAELGYEVRRRCRDRRRDAADPAGEPEGSRR